MLLSPLSLLGLPNPSPHASPLTPSALLRRLLFTRYTSPLSPPPLLLSNSSESYESVTQLTFIPHCTTSNPHPYLLCHSTDSNLIEINHLLIPTSTNSDPSQPSQPPSPPLFTFHGTKHTTGEYVALHAHNTAPPSFASTTAHWDGSLAAGSNNGTLLLFDIAHQQFDATTNHTTVVNTDITKTPRLASAVWSFDSTHTGPTSTSLFAASLCTTTSTLYLHEPRSSPSRSNGPPQAPTSPNASPAQPREIASHDLTAAIAKECATQSRLNSLHITPTVSGVTLLPRGDVDDSMYDNGDFYYSMITSHALLSKKLEPLPAHSALLIWDLRMLSAPTCVDAHQVDGVVLEGEMRVGSRAPVMATSTNEFTLAGQREAVGGSSTVSMFDCHLFAPNPITSNSTLSRFPRPGLWALNNGGDMVVDVFKNDMSAFDEELRMTRIKSGRGFSENVKKRKGFGDSDSGAVANGAAAADSAYLTKPATPTNRYVSSDVAVLMKGHEYEITACGFSDDDSMFATGDSFGHVMLHMT